MDESAVRPGAGEPTPQPDVVVPPRLNVPVKHVCLAGLPGILEWLSCLCLT